MIRCSAGWLVFVAWAAGCARLTERREAATSSGSDTAGVEVAWSAERLSAAQLDSGRSDTDWRSAPSIDSLLHAGSVVALRLPPDTFPRPAGGAGNQDAADRLARDFSLPLAGPVDGPSVLYLQTLLDRSPFSPGIIDGRWGQNTVKALFWLQSSEGLPATGILDSTTFHRLVDLAGRPAGLIDTVTLGEEAVAGPFEDIPARVPDRASLSCLCYESLGEKLAERFHATPEVLRQLNPGVALDSLAAGSRLAIPNGRMGAGAEAAPGGDSTGGDSLTRSEPESIRLVISDRGRYLHVVDPAGRILRHFPSTLGSSFSPSPSGSLSVVRVTRSPWFHWQPRRLEGVDDRIPPVRLPPGPNSPVGLVWIQLSREHYGIHGTNEPDEIGYRTSSGCVRLTNWDALLLASLVRPGTPVEFRDVSAGADVARRLP